MSSPIRRDIITLMSLTTLLRSSGRGWVTCRRLNASNWPVNDAARSAATRMPPIACWSGLPVGVNGAVDSQCARMMVSRLLKSCATPAARRPIASIFCAWRSCASSSRRVVTSRAMPCAAMMAAPSRSGRTPTSSVMRRPSAVITSISNGFTSSPAMTRCNCPSTVDSSSGATSRRRFTPRASLAT